MIAYIVRRSIRHAGIVVTVAAALVVYGFYVLTRANLDVFPEFSPSQVVIQTEAPGFSSELVERQVTQPIESALAGLSGLDAMRSQSIGGLSVVTLAFREGTNAYRNRQIVGERLALVATPLPVGDGPEKNTPLSYSASHLLSGGHTPHVRRI